MRGHDPALRTRESQTSEPRLDRLLVIAPHPDDDVIGAGGLIQRALARGGVVRVLFLTAGESNVWPQRALLRRWRITAADRSEWAALRLREASAALERLGAPAACFELLGLPDQKLTEVLRRNADGPLAAIAERVRQLDPTFVAAPSMFDVHADHRAASYLAHLAVGDREVLGTYIVHGRVPPERVRLRLELTAGERARKREAIEAHATQMLLGRGRYTAYASDEEIFCRSEEDLVVLDRPARHAWIRVRHAVHAVAHSVSGWLRRKDRHS